MLINCVNEEILVRHASILLCIIIKPVEIQKGKQKIDVIKTSVYYSSYTLQKNTLNPQPTPKRILDRGMAFPIAHSVRTSLDMFGSLEDVIIVGIEYEWEQSLTPWMTTRWKDFTPTKMIKGSGASI